MLEKDITGKTKNRSKNPYMFVVGCPRSGTTLLQRMLDNHPMLAVSNDTHFIPAGIQRRFDGTDPLLTPTLVERVLHYRRFHRLGLPMGEAHKAAETATTYSGFVSALYSSFCKLRGKEIAGEKTPDYVKYLPLLHGLFPWARILHIIRDGRDVALSTLEWAKEDKGPGRYVLWKDEPVAVCALWWRWQVSTGRRDGEILGSGRYHELKYEELIYDPEDVLKRIAAFLDLPFSMDMVNYFEGKARPDEFKEGKISIKKAWLPPTSGLRDWRREMKERDIALFEAIAGDLLSELGYELISGRIPTDIAVISKHCRRWWKTEMERRREKGRVFQQGINQEK